MSRPYYIREGPVKYIRFMSTIALSNGKPNEHIQRSITDNFFMDYNNKFAYRFTTQ